MLATKGFARGGVLSPRIWNLVADELLILNKAVCHAESYSDDFVIVVREEHVSVLEGSSQFGLEGSKKIV